MKALAALALATVCALGFASLTQPAIVQEEGATQFTIDNVHSSVIFKLTHQDVSWFYGRFNKISGSITVAEKAEDCKVSMKIDAASIDTKTKDLDDHLKSADFFDVAQFPEITFESKRVAKKGDNYAVTGDLSLHGVTKEVTLDIEKVAEREGRRGKKAGFHTVFTVDRLDYGLGKKGGVGEEVEIIVSVEAGAR